ncbi:MAG: sulfide:quinone oxidoreductase [Gammaproteobacteria bacterium]|jgi:sulfide:quinone oxidoreductase|uniref:NAD(P)/FAD-dependent oxidoreductase n=1 Tax=Thalassolituus oleivorans TaxID=187493 RepID=UPI000949299E|nr:FAD-dependent oxidoreductase [Thalassolituus oleivorans]APR67931.1 pyridine nucleotide-disulfide oxidoreductase [Thalassolituus oleivorans]
MARVIVLGAGTGGMAGAYEIRESIGSEHQVTVINEREDFQFVPSNPWIAVGWRERPDTSFPIRPYLEKKNIEFISAAVTAIDPKQNSLTLADGRVENYDYLVIATGPKLNFAAVEGAGPHGGYTQSICALDHAETCFEDVKALAEEPGPVIVGAMPGASCFGPAYEYAFILDKELRNRKKRDKVPMTYVTSEPYIGHLGLGGVGDSKSMLESELRNRHIQWITNAQVTKVEAGKMFVDELNDDGSLKKQHELPFKHSMMLPSFAGVDPVAAVKEICNPKGFVIIDEHQRNPTYPNIYSAGVCVAIPPVEVTPVPTGTPKTGYMIESMMTAIAHNLKSDLAGEPATAKGTWSAICLADMGDTGAAFVAIPQIPPRNVTWFKKGKWVHVAKIAFEKYFIHKMKTGSSEPIYEKYTLKALGINRLKDE